MGDHGPTSALFAGAGSDARSFTFRGERLSGADQTAILAHVPFEEMWFEGLREFRFRASRTTTPFAEKRRLAETWTQVGGEECTGEFRWTPVFEGNYTTVSGLLGCIEESGYGDRRIYGIGVRSVDSARNQSEFRCLSGCDRPFTIGAADHRGAKVLGDVAVWIR